MVQNRRPGQQSAPPAGAWALQHRGAADSIIPHWPPTKGLSLTLCQWGLRLQPGASTFPDSH